MRERERRIVGDAKNKKEGNAVARGCAERGNGGSSRMAGNISRGVAGSEDADRAVAGGCRIGTITEYPVRR